MQDIHQTASMVDLQQIQQVQPIVVFDDGYAHRTVGQPQLCQTHEPHLKLRIQNKLLIASKIAEQSRQGKQQRSLKREATMCSSLWASLPALQVAPS